MKKRTIVIFIVIALAVNALSMKIGYTLGINKISQQNSTDTDSLEWIVRYYEQSCGTIEFTRDAPPSYNDIISYFLFNGCYNAQMKNIRQNMIAFYDGKNCFSVPYDIVDTFMKERFEVEPNKETVDIYNNSSQTYEFICNNLEFYYNLEIISQKELEKDIYEVIISKKHAINSDILNVKKRYLLEIKDDKFKYLAVETIN